MRNTRCMSDGFNRLNYLKQVLWVNLKNCCITAESGNCCINVATGHRTNATEVLAQYEIGGAAGERVVVKVVEIEARSHALFDDCVNVAGRHARFCESVDHNFAACSRP